MSVHVTVACCLPALEAGLAGPELFGHLISDHRDDLPSELVEPIDNFMDQLAMIVADLAQTLPVAETPVLD